MYVKFTPKPLDSEAAGISEFELIFLIALSVGKGRLQILGVNQWVGGWLLIFSLLLALQPA